MRDDPARHMERGVSHSCGIMHRESSPDFVAHPSHFKCADSMQIDTTLELLDIRV